MLCCACCDDLSVQDAKPAVETKPKKAKEPTSFTVANPSRVVPAQVRFLSLPPDNRYRPVRHNAVLSGVMILADNDPESPEEVLKVEKISLGQSELAPPFEPFEWDPNDDS